jgi:hypothetical protein
MAWAQDFSAGGARKRSAFAIDNSGRYGEIEAFSGLVAEPEPALPALSLLGSSAGFSAR